MVESFVYGRVSIQAFDPRINEPPWTQVKVILSSPLIRAFKSPRNRNDIVHSESSSSLIGLDKQTPKVIL